MGRQYSLQRKGCYTSQHMSNRQPSQHVAFHLHFLLHYSAGWKAPFFTSAFWVYISISSLGNFFLTSYTDWSFFRKVLTWDSLSLTYLVMNLTSLFLQCLKYAACHTTAWPHVSKAHAIVEVIRNIAQWSIWLHWRTSSSCLRKKKSKGSSLCQGSRSESQRFYIQGMPLVIFNVYILSRNGRFSEVGHLPDDITIKANGSLMTYKLFGVTYGNGDYFKSAMCLPSTLVPQAGWYE